jgi:PAS domain S-box-containing protein
MTQKTTLTTSALPPKPDGSEESAFRQLTPEGRLAHLGAIIEFSNDAIFSVTLDGKILSWNAGAERIYGYTAEEMVGNRVSAFVPQDRRNELDRVIQQLREGENPASFETRRVRKDGRVIHVYLTVSPVRDSEGALIGTSTIARDISERKTAEQALRKKQQELEDFFENSVLGLHWVGPDGRIIWANRAEMQSLGYSACEYIGHHIAEFHADPDVIQDILARLARNEKLHSYEARLKCKDGSLRHVLISSSVLWDDDKFIHTRCFTLDITERRRTEQALRRAEKMAATGRLAATVAHEINNPLEAVTNLLYLAKTAPTVANTKECLEQAQAELKRISHLTKQTLGFFKDSTAPSKIDLSNLVREVIRLYQSKINSKGLTVKSQLEPSLVLGSEGELRQVVSNLLTNAVESSRDGRTIRVRVHAHHELVRLTVADQGSGIMAGNIDRIYEPFFTTKENVGTGLGLWVTREIVDKHGGKIQLRTSVQPGRSGTAFSILLPSAS